MGEENMEVEDWDPSFLELLIQQEEIALSSCTQTGNLIQTQNRQTSSSSFLPPPPPQQQPLGFSPPRVFSQQTTDYSSVTVENTINGGQVQFAAPRTPTRRRRASGNAKDLEIDRSKMECSPSKMLTEKVDERLELKKETSKYKPVDSSKDVQATHLQRLKTPNLEPETPVAADQGAPQNFHNANALDAKPGMHRAESSLEDAGVQANLHTCLELSKKLQSIWAPPSDYNSGRSTISKLFVDCPTDFSVLFGFMKGDSSSKVCCLEVESSADVISQHSKHSFQRVDASKVSNFHYAITKVSDGMMPLEAIFEPLFDLCRVENDAISYRSLRILHALLKQLLTFERRSEGREFVVVEGLHSRSAFEEFLVGDEASDLSNIPPGIKISKAEIFGRKGYWGGESAMPFSRIDWVSLFELMRMVATKAREEPVKLEAVSIMKTILMRSNAFTEREKFGEILMVETISQLLKKKSGMHVQKETVHLLFLLLNCPKLLVTFCSGGAEGEIVSAAKDKDKRHSVSKEFSMMILEGLADCISCCGNGLQELELNRQAIILLAFIASSGKSGFNILVNHKLSREATFLMLILQLIVSELDTEATVHTESDETFRARTLLMREVLILLNRLVSNPAYSTTFLRALTYNRDMASLTIDIATRLSRNKHNLAQPDTMFKQMRESEIIDLGRVFKKRVYAFLGDKIH